MQFFDEIGLDLWVLTEQVAGPRQGDRRGFMASQKKGHHLIAQLRIRPSADGVVFKLDPTGTETELHSFTGGGDGGYPAGLVLDRAGNLYGTTKGGGAYGYGTVFKLVPGADDERDRFTQLIDVRQSDSRHHQPDPDDNSHECGIGRYYHQQRDRVDDMSSVLWTRQSVCGNEQLRIQPRARRQLPDHRDLHADDGNAYRHNNHHRHSTDYQRVGHWSGANRKRLTQQQRDHH